jgi:flagellar hook-length control protein FliK
MPEITTLPPTASTPFELLIPRSEPGADDQFARRLASASEGGEQRQAPETAAKVKPNSTKKSEPVSADEAPVESAEESELPVEPTGEPTNELAQQAAAAAAVAVAIPVETQVVLPVEPELAVVEDVAATPPEAPPVQVTSDVPFAEVLAETELPAPEQTEAALNTAADAEGNPTTAAEVVVAPVTSTTPTFTSTDQPAPPAPIEARGPQPATPTAAQPQEGPSPPASRLSATSPVSAESQPSTDSTEGDSEESSEVADEGDRIETANEQLTATDLTAADQSDQGREQTDRSAAEPRVEPRAETPTPTREPEPQRTIDRLPGGAAAGVRQNTTNDGPVINAQRFVSRVSRAFESARDNGGSIHLRLSPPELGEMALRLSLNDGVLTAQIETDTQSARNALLDNLPALRERLAQQEIRIDKFEVDVRQQGSGSNSRESYTGSESPSEQPSPDSRRPRRDVPTETERPTRRIATQAAGNGRINYVA